MSPAFLVLEAATVRRSYDSFVALVSTGGLALDTIKVSL